MSLDEYVFGGGTAVVTGAAGGMGAHVAAGLARRGSHLALADRDGDALARVAADLRARHPRVLVTEHVVDLSEPAAVTEFVAAARAAHGPITLLVNNAGIAMAGTFAQLTPDDIDRVMAVNFRAPVLLVHLLLPDLLATPGSHIVNVSSLFGLVAPAGQSAYAASKFALRGFSESLRAELAGRVGVTVVHPGGIRTNIARNAIHGSGVDPAQAHRGQEAFEKVLTFPADRAAELMIDAVRRRRTRLLIGASATVPDVLARAVPAHYDPILARLLGSRPARRDRTGDDGNTGRAGDDGDAGRGSAPPGAVPLPVTGAGMRTVDVGGTPVRVRVTGPADAPVAVLVHGIGRSLEDFTELHELLPDRRVVSFDLPGFGLTPPAPPRPGVGALEAFADTTVALLDALGVADPVDLVGNSLGGAVAQYVLARHPARVRSLALLASAGFGAEVTPALRVLSVPVLGERLLATASPASLRRSERSVYADGSFVTRERLAHAARVAANPGRAQAFLGTLREIGSLRGVRPAWRADLAAAVAAHPVPTLIVWGDRDLVLPTAHLDAAARAMPHARTHRFEHTGHLPQVERAPEVADLLRDLWRQPTL